MGHYQTFPGAKGASESLAKLNRLPFPSLRGTSFLDVGCNEGYFCGYAFFEGASSVTGIDKNIEFIEKARKRFPECEFINEDWMQFLSSTQRKFDVILCASSIHYADDQKSLIRAMVDCLKPNGVILLEMGVAKADAHYVVGKPSQGWLKCKRSIDERLFPTWEGLAAMLAPYAWKYVFEGVNQAGDDVPRQVVIISRPLPYAILLIGDSATGKTTASNRIFGHLPIVHADHLWLKILEKEDKYPNLAAMIRNGDCVHINKLVEKMFKDDCEEEYIKFIKDLVGNNDFVYDGYIPSEYRSRFIQLFRKAGFMSIDFRLPPIELDPWERSCASRQEGRKYEMYLKARSERRLSQNLSKP